MSFRRILLLSLVLSVTAAAAVALFGRTAARYPPHQQQAPARPPSVLAGMLPPGALLTIDSPDFASLLHAWTSSPESTAWLGSASYSVFSNSRLFGRLAAAQQEFASTAKLPEAGTSLLEQVAGGESIFAWYDIGDLQFLYITRMPADRAQATALFAQRASFARRQAGSSVFYVRTERGTDSGRDRTVAFASVGDLLLLATRADLMAAALQLVAAPGPGSMAVQPWYTEASAAQPGEAAAPALHMVLDLARIVPMPYFRSYWVQQNISEFKGYRSAVSDLYREQTAAGPRFREERTILPQSPPGSSSASGPDPDLGSLAALVPPQTQVYRAAATKDADAAVALLNEKLLAPVHGVQPSISSAPDPSLAPSLVGDATDLDTRIDTPAPVSAAASAAAMRQLLVSAGLDATLSVDTAQASPATVWLQVDSAVVFRTAQPVAPAALGDALQKLLRGSLTASSLGIELKPSADDPAILQLSGPKPLFVAQSGKLTIIASDAALLRALLTRAAQPAPAPSEAVLMAGFDHETARAPAHKMFTFLDAAGAEGASGESSSVSQEQTGNGGGDSTSTAPAFFSGNLGSLSDSFRRLRSEQVTVRHQGDDLHQTVVYQWQP